jgi:PAS domain S-box-containing protein
MPKRFIDPALFGLWCLVLLIWQLSVPVLAQTPAKNALDAKGTMDRGPAARTASAQSDLASKKVLILHSFASGQAIYQIIDESLTQAFASSGVDFNNMYFEYMDIPRNPSPDYIESLSDFYQRKFKEHKVDLIIAIHADALNFPQGDVGDLFPYVPIISVLANPNVLHSDSRRHVVALPVSVDAVSTVKEIVALKTDTRRLFVVSGSAAVDRRLEGMVKAQLQGWQGRPDIEYVSDLPMADLLKRLSHLPPESAILYITLYTDSEGKTYQPAGAARIISASSNAPVFGLFDTHLGDNGIVGGSLLDQRATAQSVVLIAADILQGKLPVQPLTIIPPSFVPMFDWLQLKRWGLKASALPLDAIILNKPVSAWERYKIYILAMMAFCLAETALIIFLIVQRRRQRVAEESLRKAEEKYRSIFEDAVEGIFETSLQGKPLTANPALARILGYSTPEEFLSSVHETANQVWVNPNGRAEYVRLLEEGNVVHDYECQFWRKDRTKVWVSLSGRRVCGPEGQTLFYSGFIEDITERKQAEEALGGRLQFEQLLSGLSARFVIIPPDQVDSEIEDGLRQILGFFQVDRCALIRTLPGKTSYQITHVASSDDVPPVPVGVELPRSIYPWAYEKLTEKHEVVSIARLDDLPAEANTDRQTCIEWGIRSYVNIPILIGESVDHIIHVSSVKSERVWPEELFPRLRLVGEIFVNALQRKQAEEASRESERILRQNESDLRKLAGKLIYAQEEERSRLARELHDDLAQRLTVFAIDVGRLEQQLMDPPAPVREELREMQNSIVRISQDVHSLSRQLHPSILDDLGLIKAAESECASFSRREGIEVVFNHENIPRVIPKDVSLSLYRIIQEGLRNISKHACAEHISVSLKGLNHDVLLSVQDDGIGFDWAEVKENPGLGFSSMRERARLIHGELSIQSQPEKGTVITLRVPLTREGE